MKTKVIDRIEYSIHKNYKKVSLYQQWEGEKLGMYGDFLDNTIFIIVRYHVKYIHIFGHNIFYYNDCSRILHNLFFRTPQKAEKYLKDHSYYMDFSENNYGKNNIKHYKYGGEPNYFYEKTKKFGLFKIVDKRYMGVQTLGERY